MFLVILFLNACEPTFESALKDETSFSNKSASKDLLDFKKAVRSSNGYLTILNEQKMDSTIEALKTLTPKARKEWEKSMNFTSLRTLFEQAMEEEEKFIEERIANGQEIKKGEHCAIVMKNPHSFLIDENGGIRMNIFVSDFSYIVNPEGIVRVCGHFFQYTENQMKILEGGNPKKLAKLKKAKEDTPADKIRVFAVYKKAKPITKQIDPIYLTEGFDIEPPSNTVGKYIRFESTLNLYWTTGNPIYDYSRQELVCIEGFGQVDCYYGYPIIGYEQLSVIDVKFESKSSHYIPLGFHYWKAYRSVWKKIEATYTANGVPLYWQKQHFNLAYMNETVYRGLRANFIGTFNYKAANEEVINLYPYQTAVREREVSIFLN